MDINTIKYSMEQNQLYKIISNNGVLKSNASMDITFLTAGQIGAKVIEHLLGGHLHMKIKEPLIKAALNNVDKNLH